MDYRFFGIYRNMSFGVYPEVSLAEARQKRDAARKLLAEGKDPMDVAREEKQAARLAAELTFRFIAKVEREGKHEITLSKHRWLLSQAYPKLGSRPICKLTTYDVYQVLRAVEAKGHYETAWRLRGICGRVVRYAVACG